MSEAPYLLLLEDEAGHTVWAGDHSTVTEQRGVLLKAALQHRLLAVGTQQGGEGTLAHVVLDGHTKDIRSAVTLDTQFTSKTPRVCFQCTFIPA